MKPLKNAIETSKEFVKDTTDKGLNLVKKLGFGALILASLASCKKDDPNEGLPNQKPKVEHNIDHVDSTKAKIFLKFEDKDGEVISGLYHVVRELPHGKIQGDTPFTPEQIQLGNDIGFHLNFDGLEPNTNYKLIVEAVYDNDGTEADHLEIPFTTEKGAEETPDPVFEYTTNTELNQVLTNWSDVVDGNTIPAGTVLAQINNQTGVKKDGVSQGETGINKEFVLQGLDGGKLEIVGNEVRVAEDMLVDSENDFNTNVTVADGIDYEVKTIIRDTENNQIQTQDFDAGKVEVQDGADVVVWNTEIEKDNGELKENYLSAYAVMEEGLNNTSYNPYMIDQTVLGNTTMFESELHIDSGEKLLKIISGTHEGKYIDRVQLGKLRTALINVASSNGQNLNAISPNNLQLMGEVIAEALENNPELFSTYYNGADGETIFLENLSDKQILAGVCGVKIFD